MEAIHIKTSGFYCKACPKVVEKALRMVEGVSDVISVKSMQLTSVLYDPEKVDAQVLCQRIKSAGFEATVFCPPRDCHAEEPPGSE